MQQRFDIDAAPEVHLPGGASPMPVKRRPVRKAARAAATVVGGRITDSDHRTRRMIPLLTAGSVAADGVACSGSPLLAAGTTAAGGLVCVTAGWSRLTSRAARLYAAGAAGYASAAAAAISVNGVSWPGPRDAYLLAGATLLSAPWAYRNRWRYHTASEDLIEFLDANEHPFAALIDPFEDFVADSDGALPGAHLADFTVLDDDLGEAADVVLRRGKQTTSMALAAWERIASAYDEPETLIILEPHRLGKKSRARLTRLRRDALADLRPWRGSTLDMATGDAVAATFFDGQPTRFRFLEPESGAVHSMVAGNTGTGKTVFLNWVFATVTDPDNPVPIVPVLIDPEDGGQSLSAWTRKLKHVAIGEEKAIQALRALETLMLDRANDMGEEGLDYFEPTKTRPEILAIVEEVPVLVKESPYKEEAKRILEVLGKRGRKRGIALILVVQVPSLEELESSTLRNMLRSGNIVCFKTGDSVNAAQLGLHVDPSLLPEFFADGSKTGGLCYIKGPDGRQAPARTVFIPKEDRARLAERAVEWPLSDHEERLWQKVFNKAVDGGNDGSTAPASPAVKAPPTTPDDLQVTAQQRQTAAEAALRILADGHPRERYEVAQHPQMRAVTTSIRTVGYALKKLVDDGLAWTAGERKPYVITDAGRAELQRRQAVA